MKNCHDCEHWGKMSCPESIKCYALDDKPYFKKRYVKPCWIKRIFLGHNLTKQTMEEKKGIDPNLMLIFGKPIDSKATAMQYALDSTATYENGNKVLHG